MLPQSPARTTLPEILGERRTRLGRAMLGDQAFNLGHRAVEIVIDDANGTQSTTLGQFRLGHSDPALRLLRRVSPAPQSFGLDLC